MYLGMFLSECIRRQCVDDDMSIGSVGQVLQSSGMPKNHPDSTLLCEWWHLNDYLRACIGKDPLTYYGIVV